MKRFRIIILVICLLLTLCPWALADDGFPDVPFDSGYAEAVSWAKEEGIAKGTPAGNLSPDNTLTRAEAVSFLWRACGSPSQEDMDTPFTDLTRDWYREAVAWAVRQGITNGVSDTAFAPDMPVTRAQMAAFIYRADGEPGKTGEGEWYADAERWAFDHILYFSGALPFGSAGNEYCLRSDVMTYLYRWCTAPAPEENNDVIILYTDDVHCSVDMGFGYAGLWQIRTALEKQGYDTILVDNGDAIQGEIIGTLSKGTAIVEIMNAMEYDAAIPGNHEYAYGMEEFLSLVKKADYKYISCNFNKEGKLVLDPYVIIEASGKKIAFVGVTTPKTLTSSTPAFFQNSDGEFIYGFLSDSTGDRIYNAVQAAADDTRAEGADYVYVMGHMGYGASFSPWSYADVISHTNGIDVFLDGHSHDTEQVVTKNKDGAEVTRSSCGSKLSAVGYSHITSDGKITETGIWTWTDPDGAPRTLGLHNKITDYIDKSMSELEEQLHKVVAHSSVLLTVNDPDAVDSNGNPIRMVRRAETNLGDFCADALRSASGADIAIMNGGGIRADLKKGDVTYSDIISVFPFGNMLCVIEATGQQILDALEWGSRYVPAQSGGFLQVSGLSYEIDVSIPSGCKTDDNGLFIGVEGQRRVKNVMTGGVPLDPEKTYTLAGTEFTLLEHGDGINMFNDCTVTEDRVKLDNQILIDYILDELGGNIGNEYADPTGQGRITIIDAVS